MMETASGGSPPTTTPPSGAGVAATVMGSGRYGVVGATPEMEEAAAYATLMRTVEALQRDLQQTVTTCHGLRESNAGMSKSLERVQGEAGRLREKLTTTRAQLVEATKAKIESDRKTELVVGKWKAQLEERTRELDAVQAKLVPQDLDMLRIEVQEELEAPHQQKIAEMESRMAATQEAYFQGRRDAERRKAEFEQYSAFQTATLEAVKQRHAEEVKSLRESVQKAEAKYRAREDATEKRVLETALAGARARVEALESEVHARTAEAVEARKEAADVVADKVRLMVKANMARADAERRASAAESKAVEVEATLLQTREALTHAQLENARLVEETAKAVRSATLSDRAKKAFMENAQSEMETLKRAQADEKDDFERQKEAESRKREALELELADARRKAADARISCDSLIEAARAEGRETLAALEDRLVASELAKTQVVRSKEAALADATADARKLEAQLKIEKARAARLEADAERGLKPRVADLERERDALLATVEDLRRTNADLDRARADAADADARTRAADDRIFHLNATLAALQSDLETAKRAAADLKAQHAADLAALKRALKADRAESARALRLETNTIKKQSQDQLKRERKRADAYKDRAVRERDKAARAKDALSRAASQRVDDIASNLNATLDRATAATGPSSGTAEAHPQVVLGLPA